MIIKLEKSHGSQTKESKKLRSALSTESTKGNLLREKKSSSEEENGPGMRYRIYRIAIDIAVRGGSKIPKHDLSHDSNDDDTLYDTLAYALDDGGFEMASRRIDILDDGKELTAQYKRRGEKFFDY